MSQKQKMGIQLAMLLADVVLMGSVLAIYTLRQTDEMRLYLFPWWMVLAAGWILNRIFTVKKAPVNLALAVDGILTVLFIFAGQNLLSLGQESFGSRILLGGLLAGSFIHSASMPMSEPRQNQLVLYLDGLVACLAILMVLNRVGSLKGIEGLLTFGGLSAGGLLLALISSRIRTPGIERLEGKKGQGWMVLGAILAVAVAVAFFAGTHLSAISSGIVFCVTLAVDGIWAVLCFIGRGVQNFLLWLASLFPSSDGEIFLPEPETGAAMEAAEAVDSGSGMLLGIMAALWIAAALVWLMRQLRGKRLTGFSKEGAGSQTGRERIKKRPWGWFRRKWRELYFWCQYLGHKRTPAGILVLAEHQGKKAGIGRAESESGPAYLRRLAASGADSSFWCLREAADALEKTFYGAKEPTLEPTMISACRKALKGLKK
ncbi:hypothetical protein [Hominifimenecus sp. rT4P-3]|uniref:hypothetical protein n=1 Tax=Hominifimenecus sp. rT4P-3 TaxID=3242979 RepID=UPI003DA5B42C